MKTISEAMYQDHCKIETLLTKFKKDKNLKNYKELLFHIESHFFTEEKAILTNHDWKEKEIQEQIHQVLKTHKTLIDIAKVIDLSSEQEFLEFEAKLIAHKKFEDETVYPRMDFVLPQGKINEIVKKIEEISG